MGLIAGLIAGLAAKKIFTSLWSAFSDEEAPSAEQESVPWSKLAGALLLEGAIFSVVRGLVDHGARVGFRRYTGAWPGENENERG